MGGPGFGGAGEVRRRTSLQPLGTEHLLGGGGVGRGPGGRQVRHGGRRLSGGVDLLAAVALGRDGIQAREVARREGFDSNVLVQLGEAFRDRIEAAMVEDNIVWDDVLTDELQGLENVEECVPKHKALTKNQLKSGGSDSLFALANRYDDVIIPESLEMMGAASRVAADMSERLAPIDNAIAMEHQNLRDEQTQAGTIRVELEEAVKAGASPDDLAALGRRRDECQGRIDTVNAALEDLKNRKKAVAGLHKRWTAVADGYKKYADNVKKDGKKIRSELSSRTKKLEKERIAQAKAKAKQKKMRAQVAADIKKRWRKQNKKYLKVITKIRNLPNEDLRRYIERDLGVTGATSQRNYVEAIRAKVGGLGAGEGPLYFEQLFQRYRADTERQIGDVEHTIDRFEEERLASLADPENELPGGRVTDEVWQQNQSIVRTQSKLRRDLPPLRAELEAANRSHGAIEAMTKEVKPKGGFIGMLKSFLSGIKKKCSKNKDKKVYLVRDGVVFVDSMIKDFDDKIMPHLDVAAAEQKSLGREELRQARARIRRARTEFEAEVARYKNTKKIRDLFTKYDDAVEELTADEQGLWVGAKAFVDRVEEMRDRLAALEVAFGAVTDATAQ